MKPRLVVLVCLLLCACKTNDPSGYLLGAPVAVTTANERAIRVKLPGFDGNPPQDSVLPPFSTLVDDIFQGVVPAPSTSPIQAMSLGLEVLFLSDISLAAATTVDGTPLPTAEDVALLSVGQHGWAALGYTVNKADLGGEPLLPDIEEARQDGTLDRTVFGYTVPGSVIEQMPIEVAGVPILRPGDLGLTDVNDAIHGLDLHTALYHSDLLEHQAVFTTRPLPLTPTVYFTLRPEYLTDLVPGQLSSKWHNVVVNSGTIYRTSFVGGAWQIPTVYLTWQQLMASETLLPGVVDGLAIDTGPATSPEITTDDHVMFSLSASTPFHAGSPAYQMLYASPGSPGKPPRRVVVKKGNQYGSLGVQLGTGRALGDSCQSDPVREYQPYVMKPLLDDFFVARRMPPQPPIDARGLPLSPMPLGLATSAYRFVLRPPTAERQYLIRTCMSWPTHPVDVKGTATVHWGRILNFENYPGPDGNIVWDNATTLTYSGKPLFCDAKLPVGGLLRPGSNPPVHTNAMLVQWVLEVGSEKMCGPLLALRY